MREPSAIEHMALNILAHGAEQTLDSGIVAQQPHITEAQREEVTLIVRQLIMVARVYGPVLLQLAQPPQPPQKGHTPS